MNVILFRLIAAAVLLQGACLPAARPLQVVNDLFNGPDTQESITRNLTVGGSTHYCGAEVASNERAPLTREGTELPPSPAPPAP